MTNCKIIYVKNEDMKFYNNLIAKLKPQKKSIITYIKELEEKTNEKAKKI